MARDRDEGGRVIVHGDRELCRVAADHRAGARQLPFGQQVHERLAS